MWFSVQKTTKLSNLTALPFALAAIAIAGALLYFLFGWSTEINIIVLCCGLFSFLYASRNLAAKKPDDDTSIFFTLTSLIPVSIGTYYLSTISPTESASIWSFVSSKFFVVATLLIVSTVIGLYTQKITRLALFISLCFLLGIHAITHQLGFGFDIFIHESTIRAWLEQGHITPYSPLYTGFYAIVAAASFIPLQLITLIQWITPITGSFLLSRAPKYNTLAFLTLFSPLFLTATPQSLGHLLLFWIVSMTDLFEPTRKSIILTFLFATGIATIHPLSGIPALIFSTLLILSHTNIPKILLYFFGLAGSLLPICALTIGTSGAFSFTSISLSAFQSFLGLNTYSAFQSTIFHEIAYSAKPVTLILFLALVFVGVIKNRSQKTTPLTISAVSTFVGAILVSGFTTQNIIGYEQNAFTDRLLLASFIIAIPLAVDGFNYIRTKSSWNAQNIFIPLTLCVIALSQWYTAFPPWNSIQKTKAINTTEHDFLIAETIENKSKNTPYIVLADQPTSAAALKLFGFGTHTLPNSPEFFYPIPTGGDIYTNYFLPAMYSDIQKEKIENLAKEYGVTHVFIVAKPYWNLPKSRLQYLQEISDEQFLVQNSSVFMFVIKK